MRLVSTSWFTSRWARRFSVMWQNILCSISFHLPVPGGKWHTLILRRVSLPSLCNYVSQRQARYPLLPLESAVISSSPAFRHARRPIPIHQSRMDATAKVGVS